MAKIVGCGSFGDTTPDPSTPVAVTAPVTTTTPADAPDPQAMAAAQVAVSNAATALQTATASGDSTAITTAVAQQASALNQLMLAMQPRPVLPPVDDSLSAATWAIIGVAALGGAYALHRYAEKHAKPNRRRVYR